MEDNSQSRQLLRSVQNANQDKNLVSDLDEFSKKFFPFKHIREDPLFQPKKPSNPLELADFCAFIWKRFLRNQNDERFLRFLNPMRSQIWAPTPRKVELSDNTKNRL